MSELPPPLVGAEVDLRAFDWFPFHHKRLRQSAFWKRASDLACRISVDFWAEAYEQVPAGSLPNDDYILAEWQASEDVTSMAGLPSRTRS